MNAAPASDVLARHLLMARTLLTGAAGFTGRYVAAALTARGHEIHAVVHDTPDEAIGGASEVHQGNLAELDAISRIVEAVRPDHVVHLAAIAFVAHGDVEQMYRSNILGTRQLLEALARSAAKPASIVLASSANVYGTAREGTQHEGQPLAPANDYGVTKVAAEYAASLYRAKLPIIVVRPFNYTGRGQSAEFIVPKIVEHARRRASVIELGNLDVARDFSDVRVVAEAYARLVSAPEAIGGTFNICSGRAISLQEVLDVVSLLTGHKLDVRVSPKFVRENEVRSLWGSPEKLKGVVGELPMIPFEDTLRWMLEA